MKFNFKSKIIQAAFLLTLSFNAYSQEYFFVIPFSGQDGLGGATPPEVTTSPDCYNPSNVGAVGSWPGCSGLFIVEDGSGANGIQTAVSSGGIVVDGSTYGPTDIFTGQVNNMNMLFMYGSFNGNIGYWDTSNVTAMALMFNYARSFNQNISKWDTSKVINMRGMFDNAEDFNQPIGGWITSNVVDMEYMFRYAMDFNQDLSGWCVNKIASKPVDFDLNSSSWVLARPAWGTCL